MALMDTILDIRVLSVIFGVILPYILYKYSTKNFSFWAEKGVKFVKPYPFIGSLFPTFIKNFELVDLDHHKKYGKIYGVYEGTKPVLMVADPQLLRNIYVKDFQYFTNRRSFNSGDNITENMMSTLRGEDWKRVRSIVSPTFSTGKIKRVMSIFQDCAKTTIQNLKASMKKDDSVDILKMYGAFTMDVIASSAFSTKIDSHNDPENKFIKMAQKVFQPTLNFRFFLFLFAPWLLKLFRAGVFDPESLEFFKNVTLQIIKERKSTGQRRNDFLQLLLDSADEVAKEELWEEKSEDTAGNYEEDESINSEVFKNTSNKQLSTDELIAQCVIFFIAGYHTTAVTLGIATHLIATHPDIQEKLYNEIRQVLSETGGELQYESIQKMKYLDNVVSETLRIYPAAIRTERQAEDEYKIGDTGITIPKGMIVATPIFALHRDPNFFPEPDKFIPDRFNSEEREKQIPYTYLPFGAGPRNCVGMRFALMELKVCLIHVISTFKLETCSKTKIPLEFRQGLGLLSPKTVILHLEPRENNPLKS